MKTTTASAEPGEFAKVKELVNDIDVAMVTTVTPDGTLRSRPMATLDFEDPGVIWFFTADDSGKARDVNEEQAVNISYAEPKKHRYVSITGNASIVHDPEKAKELWTPAVRAYFPRGLDDPHLALLCVRVQSAEYWDADRSKMVQFFQMARGALTNQPPDLGDNVKVDVRVARESG